MMFVYDVNIHWIRNPPLIYDLHLLAPGHLVGKSLIFIWLSSAITADFMGFPHARPKTTVVTMPQNPPMENFGHHEHNLLWQQINNQTYAPS